MHFHILPRKLAGDAFARNDDVYPALERGEEELKAAHSAVHISGAGNSGTSTPARGEGGVEPLKVDADEDRKPRSAEEMEREAGWLRTFFEDSK